MILAKGDKVKLLEVIKSTYRTDDWKTGVYEVIDIRPAIGQSANAKNPRMSYSFRKLKKSGEYTSFRNGYETDEFDSMISEGKVEKLV